MTDQAPGAQATVPLAPIDIRCGLKADSRAPVVIERYWPIYGANITFEQRLLTDQNRMKILGNLMLPSSRNIKEFRHLWPALGAIRFQVFRKLFRHPVKKSWLEGWPRLDIVKPPFNPWQALPFPHTLHR